MNSRNDKTSRREFFLAGSATLGAGVASSAGAAALTPATQPTLPQGEDVEAIRRLHMAFVAGVEKQTQAAAAVTHQAYRSNALQEKDQLAVGADGRYASATWHVDVKVGAPLQGDSTAAQMARLQGMLQDVHWESGRLHASYEKTCGSWEIASLRYEPA